MSYDPCAHLPPLPCYLNGEITNMREARISPLDRGFIFGDGIYEGIAVYGRPGHAPRPFRFAQHMARLERGLRETRIPNPHTADEWRQIALDLIAAYARQSSADATNDAQAAPQDWFFYFQVTRGVALRDAPGLVLLLPGHARRGAARPPHAAGADTHRVRYLPAHEAAHRRAARPGRGLRHRR